MHGGPDKAGYAYATEDYAWCADLLGRDLGAGTFGENLTTEGIDLSACVESPDAPSDQASFKWAVQDSNL